MRSNAFSQRILRLAGLLGLLLIVITACSSGGDNTNTASDSSADVETDADSHDNTATDDTIPPVINAVRVAEIGQSLIGTGVTADHVNCVVCLLYTSPSPRDATLSRMPSSA